MHLKYVQGGRFAVALDALWARRFGACLAVALAAMLLPTAVQSSGLFLSWNDCSDGELAAPDQTFSCSSDVGEEHLYCALRPAQAIDSVLALEIVIDLQSQSATLPDWWQVGVAGCRSKQLRADDDFLSKSCDRIWEVEPAGGVLDFSPGMPRGQPNQARILIALAVPSGEAGVLMADTMYYASRVVLTHARTVGAPVCAGCVEPVCLVLNSILVRRPPRPLGAPTSDVLIEGPGEPGANRVTWQSGGSGLCDAVPVRRTTWGAVKDLYR